MIFTPLDITTGERLRFDIDEQDIPRGRLTSFVVDINGKEYNCRTTRCNAGSGCICDAVILDYAK